MAHIAVSAGRTKIARGALLTLLATLLLTGSCVSQPKAPRPERWAEPVAAKSLQNFFRLSTEVYRSAQPTRMGFEDAWRAGIKSVLNLRERHSDAPLVAGLDMTLFEVPMNAGAFGEEEIVKALRAIQSAPKPVLIHCQHGSDRAGVVAAMYRIVFEGWTKEDALDELRHGGFGFHFYYVNIPAFIRAADVDRIKARLNLTPARRAGDAIPVSANSR